MFGELGKQSRPRQDFRRQSHGLLTPNVRTSSQAQKWRFHTSTTSSNCLKGAKRIGILIKSQQHPEPLHESMSHTRGGLIPGRSPLTSSQAFREGKAARGMNNIYRRWRWFRSEDGEECRYRGFACSGSRMLEHPHSAMRPGRDAKHSCLLLEDLAT